METAVKKLEYLLTKTEHDVDALSAKLDKEFALLSEANSVKSHVEPSAILNNIRQLRSELTKITEDVTEFQKEQNDVMAKVKEQISGLSDQFLELNAVNEASQECEKSVN